MYKESKTKNLLHFYLKKKKNISYESNMSKTKSLLDFILTV